MKRRKFLKLSGAAATSLFLPRVYSEKGLIINQSIETLIIGSGYGGAVAALRLTQAGYPVTILEMGLNWSTTGDPYKPFSEMSGPKENSTWLRNKTIAPLLNAATFPNKFTGVLDRADYEDIKIYFGRGVGGGSLVNGGMAVTPKQEYFAEVFPDLSTHDFYTKYFPKAKAQLEVNEISERFYEQTEYYKFSRVGEREAADAGFATTKIPNVYDFAYMEQEDKKQVPRSAFNKELIYGNNYGKKSLDKTYLKSAFETGLLTILDLHQVVDIIRDSDETFKVMVSVIDTGGNLKKRKSFTCKKLFLCAGSLGTTQLLTAARGKGNLRNLPDAIGINWGNNGNIMTGRNFINTVFNKVNTTPKKQGRGTGGSQSTIPVAAIDNWNDPEHPFFAEISPCPMGMEVYTSLYLLINKVPKKGFFYWDKATQSVMLKWDKTNWEESYINAKYFIERLRKTNGGTRAHLLFKNGFDPDICYHPLGGCVLGQCTDHFGRINGYKNLYALDGSLVPGTIGVNPFLTITALAEYCIEDIIQKDF